MQLPSTALWAALFIERVISYYYNLASSVGHAWGQKKALWISHAAILRLQVWPHDPIGRHQFIQRCMLRCSPAYVDVVLSLRYSGCHNKSSTDVDLKFESLFLQVLIAFAIDKSARKAWGRMLWRKGLLGGGSSFSSTDVQSSKGTVKGLPLFQAYTCNQPH